MRHPDSVSGVFWLGIGLLLSLWSASYKVGNFREPGPGLLPLILGLLLILFSFILLIQAKRSSPASPGSSALFHPGGWKRVSYTVSIMLLAVFLYEPLGYLLTFFLLLTFLIRGAGSQQWRATLLITLLSLLSIYLIFVLLLKQQLPKGILGI